MAGGLLAFAGVTSAFQVASCQISVATTPVGFNGIAMPAATDLGHGSNIVT
jgi:hypothetical protein